MTSPSGGMFSYKDEINELRRKRDAGEKMVVSDDVKAKHYASGQCDSASDEMDIDEGEFSEARKVVPNPAEGYEYKLGDGVKPRIGWLARFGQMNLDG